MAEKNSAYLQVSYHYDGAGRLLNRILSNGAQTDYSYDDDNRLTGLKNTSANGAVVENLTYTRDRIGNITGTTDAVSGRSVTYTYNARYQLTNVNSSINSEDRAYTYDAVGNRKTETANGTTYYYCYHASNCSAAPSGNRLINIRTGSLTGPLYRQFTYDDSGRVLQKQDGAGAPLYMVTYNGKGRASQISGSQTDTFAYDPNDYRIQKDSNLYHLEGKNLEATYSNTGVLQNKYLRGVVVDEIVNGYTYHSANANDWTNYTFHHDHLNSVTALTGHAGSTEETTKYDAFGAPLSLVIPGTGNDLLYTGREYDRGTGLYYYRARYYDPEIGRFISEDPKGFSAGINFYAYVNNNPVNLNDPMGLKVYLTGRTVQIAGFTLGGPTEPPLHMTVVMIPDNPGDFANNKNFNPLGENNVAATVSGFPENGPGISALFGTDNLALKTNFNNDALANQVYYQEIATPNGISDTQFINNIFSAADAYKNGQSVSYQAWAAGNSYNSNSLAAGLLGAAGADVGDSLVSGLAPGFDKPVPISIPSPVASSDAFGGFVLYPNKINTNMIQRVYSK